MSYNRALKTIHLDRSEEIAHLENLDHPLFMQELVGFDPWENPRQAYIDAYTALDIDWIIGIPGRSIRFDNGISGVRDRNGFVLTEWGLSGSAWREDYQFDEVEDVLAFDPVINQNSEKLLTLDYARAEIDRRRSDQEMLGSSAIVSGIYYTMLFQFGIMIFNWELFLSAAASDAELFRRVLEGFAAVSHRNMELWAQEDINLLFVHDDIAIEQGMVFRPDWYRKNVFPLYEYILEPVKTRKNLKVAFVSDGDYSAVLNDLVSVGFDGFVINSPAMDLGEISQKLGDRAFLAGGIDTNVLTLGQPDDVRKEVRDCLEKTRPARGFFMHSGGDLPHNIPLENMRAYFHATGRI